jgi:Uma2 family endonuclease
MKPAYVNIDFPTPMTLYKSLPESSYAEVIDNVLYVSEPTTIYHQATSDTLLFDLMKYVRKNKLGEVRSCPGVFRKGTVVIPDLVFISRDNKKIVKKREGLYGPPDLVIEVLSPSTKYKDIGTKKELYERMRVREYWTVHPEKKYADGFLLKGRKFGEPLRLYSKIHVRILNKIFSF